MSESERPIRTDRIGLLADQLSDAAELSRLRIDGVTNDEITWEPWPGMWSIRPRSEAQTPDAFGPGDFVLDHESGLDPFSGGPLSTMAWRVGHLTSAFAGRWEWTFGQRQTDPQLLVDFEPTTVMVDRLWIEIDRWLDEIEAMTDDQLDQPGFGQYPYGLDPHIPFVGIIRWMNREAIHHLAEVALLRDLYRAIHEQ